MIDLGDALSDGLLVDDVDESLSILVRRGAPLRRLRRDIAVYAPVAISGGRRRPSSGGRREERGRGEREGGGQEVSRDAS